jgi:hypothetical protein
MNTSVKTIIPGAPERETFTQAEIWNTPGVYAAADSVVSKGHYLVIIAGEKTYARLFVTETGRVSSSHNPFGTTPLVRSDVEIQLTFSNY